MLKILQARLQLYMNRELPDVQTGFRKGRGTRDQTVKICWIIEKVREFQKKHLHLLYWLCQRLCVDHNKLWKILQEVCARSCLTLCNPMDCSPPDSSVHGIFQARILVWVAISFSRRSSWPRDRICVSCISCIGRWILYHWATWELLRTNH